MYDEKALDSELGSFCFDQRSSFTQTLSRPLESKIMKKPEKGEEVKVKVFGCTTVLWFHVPPPSGQSLFTQMINNHYVTDPQSL